MNILRELIALSVLVGILIVTALMLLLLTGCKGNGIDIKEIHDERANIGCVAVSADGTSYLKMANGELCKVFCSEQLPDGFSFEYDRNGCKISVGEEND